VTRFSATPRPRPRPSPQQQQHGASPGLATALTGCEVSLNDYVYLVLEGFVRTFRPRILRTTLHSRHAAQFRHAAHFRHVAHFRHAAHSRDTRCQAKTTAIRRAGNLAARSDDDGENPTATRTLSDGGAENLAAKTPGHTRTMAIVERDIAPPTPRATCCPDRRGNRGTRATRSTPARARAKSGIRGATARPIAGTVRRRN
jgi:hypothetical protein